MSDNKQRWKEAANPPKTVHELHRLIEGSSGDV
jgi:hypothetical protein